MPNNDALRSLADVIEAELDQIERMPTATFRKMHKAIAALRSISVAQGQGFVLDAGSTRYLCDGPNGYFYTGDMEIARRLVNIIDPAPTAEGDWTITDLTNPYGPAAPAQPDGAE